MAVCGEVAVSCESATVYGCTPMVKILMEFRVDDWPKTFDKRCRSCQYASAADDDTLLTGYRDTLGFGTGFTLLVIRGAKSQRRWVAGRVDSRLFSFLDFWPRVS